MNTEMTAEEAKVFFVYDKETGFFAWKRHNRRAVGGQQVTRSNSDGYLWVALNGKRYVVHRIAWLLVTGEWPSGVIDHVNQVKSDNRWTNLRLADRRGNAANSSKLSTRNTSGFKGVSQRRGRWTARINSGGKYISLGMFDTPEEAAEAYQIRHRETHGDFSPF